VEGAHLTASRDDRLDNSFQIRKHFSRSNAHNLEPFPFQKCVASAVTPWLIAQAVLLPVNLDNETMAEAGEIDRYPFNRELLAELQAVGPRLKRSPQ